MEENEITTLSGEILQFGDLLVVRATLAKGGQQTQSLQEVEGNAVSAAWDRARNALTGERNPEPAKATVTDFPTEPEPPAPPRPVEPLAKRAITPPKDPKPPKTAPSESTEGKLDPGILAALQDACKAEDVAYKKPSSNAQAMTWIRALREHGATEITDDLVLPEAEEDAA